MEQLLYTLPKMQLLKKQPTLSKDTTASQFERFGKKDKINGR